MKHYAVPPVPSVAPAGMRWYWSTIDARWHLEATR